MSVRRALLATACMVWSCSRSAADGGQTDAGPTGGQWPPGPLGIRRRHVEAGVVAREIGGQHGVRLLQRRRAGQTELAADGRTVVPQMDRDRRPRPGARVAAEEDARLHRRGVGCGGGSGQWPECGREEAQHRHDPGGPSGGRGAAGPERVTEHGHPTWRSRRLRSQQGRPTAPESCSARGVEASAIVRCVRPVSPPAPRRPMRSRARHPTVPCPAL